MKGLGLKWGAEINRPTAQHVADQAIPVATERGYFDWDLLKVSDIEVFSPLLITQIELGGATGTIQHANLSSAAYLAVNTGVGTSASVEGIDSSWVSSGGMLTKYLGGTVGGMRWLRLKHEDLNANPADRILTPGGVDHIVVDNYSLRACVVIYDTVSSRWRVIITV